MRAPWIIVGQGIAGTCLAWQLWQRGIPFRIVDSGEAGSSRVAAGMINPITGKNFQQSENIAAELPGAIAFYTDIGRKTGSVLWHPFPIHRLAESEKEWAKISRKLEDAEVRHWVSGTLEPPPPWCGGVVVSGGGRLDTGLFLDVSREFFRSVGIISQARESHSSSSEKHIWCDGAAGLLTGRLGPHRCAKGEMLILESGVLSESEILIGGGGWIVPLGNGKFKAGATYEWDDLTMEPTVVGKARVLEIAEKLAGEKSFSVVDHVVGIRPIIQRSKPVIGKISGSRVFNGLGSKGSLYAPGYAAHFAEMLAAETA